jgi:hypothetical protein
LSALPCSATYILIPFSDFFTGSAGWHPKPTGNEHSFDGDIPTLYAMKDFFHAPGNTRDYLLAKFLIINIHCAL